MGKLINVSYFQNGDLYIPNTLDLNAQISVPTTTTDLEFYILEYERELILNALGIVLYTEYESALKNLEAADEKWKDLINGVTYVNESGTSKRWEGLLGVNKQSVVACYVFTQYLRNYNETFMTTGIVKNNSKNATNESATPKFIKAYRKFINQYQGDFEYAPQFYINEFGTHGLDYYSSENATVSLYQFLTDSNELDKTKFPNFTFKFYEQTNSFGI
tara:strand:+ start:139 stop:792 length:654 start_codon:yes stop_codon:yes gene_type:complete